MCIYTSAQTVTLVWIQVITASFTQTKIIVFDVCLCLCLKEYVYARHFLYACYGNTLKDVGNSYKVSQIYYAATICKFL